MTTMPTHFHEQLAPCLAFRDVEGSWMIPDFDDHGYLPPGIHAATLDEIADSTGKSQESGGAGRCCNIESSKYVPFQ